MEVKKVVESYKIGLIWVFFIFIISAFFGELILSVLFLPLALIIMNSLYLVAVLRDYWKNRTHGQGFGFDSQKQFTWSALVLLFLNILVFFTKGTIAKIAFSMSFGVVLGMVVYVIGMFIKNKRNKKVITSDKKK